MENNMVNYISYHDIGDIIETIDNLQSEMEMAEIQRSGDDADRLFGLIQEEVTELVALFGEPGTLTMVDGDDTPIVTVDYGTVLVNGKLIDIQDDGGWEELSYTIANLN